MGEEARGGRRPNPEAGTLVSAMAVRRREKKPRLEVWSYYCAVVVLVFYRTYSWRFVIICVIVVAGVHDDDDVIIFIVIVVITDIDVVILVIICIALSFFSSLLFCH